MTIDEERREFLARIGAAGGRKGGKRSLETMTKAARITRAYLAGKQGGAPRKIDHAKVIEMRNSGKQGCLTVLGKQDGRGPGQR